MHVKVRFIIVHVKFLVVYVYVRVIIVHFISTCVVELERVINLLL